MPVTAVVGGHWGDEGKGKVINLLSRDADLVIRGHGGANAGHTVVNEQGRFAVHLIPAGIFNPRATCIIGPGVAVHPGLLVAERQFRRVQGWQEIALFLASLANAVSKKPVAGGVAVA